MTLSLTESVHLLSQLDYTGHGKPFTVMVYYPNLDMLEGKIEPDTSFTSIMPVGSYSTLDAAIKRQTQILAMGCNNVSIIKNGHVGFMKVAPDPETIEVVTDPRRPISEIEESITKQRKRIVERQKRRELQAKLADIPGSLESLVEKIKIYTQQSLQLDQIEEHRSKVEAGKQKRGQEILEQLGQLSEPLAWLEHCKEHMTQMGELGLLELMVKEMAKLQQQSSSSGSSA